MKAIIRISVFVGFTFLISCSGNKTPENFESDLKALELVRGDVTLCGSGKDEFGKVDFSMACSEKVRADFNLATAILHSFEYTEAEKVFAKVIDQDPSCVMAYWGVAMSNFHPLWEPPSKKNLAKGARTIALGRAFTGDKTSKESSYLEAIATIYDDWENLDHRTRLGKFEKATQAIYEKYPEDIEASIFYCLALRASSDPEDKTFEKQKRAGEILRALYAKQPNHPGIAHYLIHVYDYPELADMGLDAARAYSSIAAASAHAQHMPSHIFTRLGLWDEAVQSNTRSVSAAQCYAQNTGIKGHWDEELHGMDYLTYAYLQAGNDVEALKQLEYLKTITEIFPEGFKGAYSFAAIPTRIAIERKDWVAASTLELAPAGYPWDRFPWERSNVTFGRLLGAVHQKKLNDARIELDLLQTAQKQLADAGETYKANLVLVQVKTGDAWIQLATGNRKKALALMIAAADLEDRTEKHSVTPGEVVPARELLGDMYMEIGQAAKALEAYNANLQRRPNRFNSVAGAALATETSGDVVGAKKLYEQLIAVAPSSERPELVKARGLK